MLFILSSAFGSTSLHSLFKWRGPKHIISVHKHKSLHIPPKHITLCTRTRTYIFVQYVHPYPNFVQYVHPFNYHNTKLLRGCPSSSLLSKHNFVCLAEITYPTHISILLHNIDTYVASCRQAYNPCLPKGKQNLLSLYFNSQGRV